jgi:hypothetical protein
MQKSITLSPHELHARITIPGHQHKTYCDCDPFPSISDSSCMGSDCDSSCIGIDSESSVSFPFNRNPSSLTMVWEESDPRKFDRMISDLDKGLSCYEGISMGIRTLRRGGGLLLVLETQRVYKFY